MALITLNKLALPTGSVLQTIQSSSETAVTNNGSSYTDIMTASITPTLTSSKILILTSVQLRSATGGNFNDCWCGVRILRGSTVIWSPVGDSRPYEHGYSDAVDNTERQLRTRWSTEYLDSPASISEQTYKLQLGAYTARNASANENNTDNGSSFITLMEIKA
jgi:hypothetical protein